MPAPAPRQGAERPGAPTPAKAPEKPPGHGQAPALAGAPGPSKLAPQTPRAKPEMPPGGAKAGPRDTLLWASCCWLMRAHLSVSSVRCSRSIRNWPSMEPSALPRSAIHCCGPASAETCFEAVRWPRIWSNEGPCRAGTAIIIGSPNMPAPKPWRRGCPTAAPGPTPALASTAVSAATEAARAAASPLRSEPPAAENGAAANGGSCCCCFCCCCCCC
mmetsp:Transcript_116412/g.370343  ORF Transcript_116412/g.370343 Transcript_116412/m.370343 type:complete len:217 (-) Transcript_116412:10-660(-)